MRFYRKEDSDRLLFSVTTFLTATAPASQQKRLAGAIERLGKEEMLKRRQAGADRGSRVHNYAEKLLLGERPALLFEEDKPYFDAIVRFKEANLFTIVNMEEIVYSYDLGYAGRYDILCRDKAGRLGLLDLKSFKGYTNPHSGYETKRWYLYPKPRGKNIDDSWSKMKDNPKKAFLQLAAYKYAREEMIPGEVIEFMSIIVLCSDGVFQQINFPTKHWDKCLGELQRRIKKFKKMQSEGTLKENEERQVIVF